MYTKYLSSSVASRKLRYIRSRKLSALKLSYYAQHPSGEENHPSEPSRRTPTPIQKLLQTQPPFACQSVVNHTERAHTRIVTEKSSNSWQKAPVFSHFSLAFSTFAVLLRKGSQILKTCIGRGRGGGRYVQHTPSHYFPIFKTFKKFSVFLSLSHKFFTVKLFSVVFYLI